jgi:hypothetical protein
MGHLSLKRLRGGGLGGPGRYGMWGGGLIYQGL